MADPYADLANAPTDMQNAIVDSMVARAVDPAQLALRRAYLAPIELPTDACAVEFGSGTGHVTCELIDVVGAATAIGIEPSPVMVDRARHLHAGRKNVRFVTGDAKRTRLEPSSCDMVLMHTLLCHVPGPEDVIAEAARVLKPGGVLAICDGDYDTATTAIADFDRLEQVVKFMINENVTNLHIMRRIGPMLAAVDFDQEDAKGHSYLADSKAAYFLTVVDRAAPLMASRGLISDETAQSLVNEARDRQARKAFFGFMSYVSLVARKRGEQT